MSTAQQTKLIESARNVITRVERDELRDYTRGVEGRKLAQDDTRVSNDTTRVGQEGTRVGNDTERLGLERTRVGNDTRRTDAEIEATNRRLSIDEAKALVDAAPPTEFTTKAGATFVWKGGSILPAKPGDKISNGDEVEYTAPNGTKRTAFFYEGKLTDKQTGLPLTTTRESLTGEKTTGSFNREILGETDLDNGLPGNVETPTVTTDKQYANDGKPIGPEDAAKLKPGTWFIGIDGKPRQRK
jgi:hypothetical protein